MPRLSPFVPRLAAVLALAALTTACGHNMEQRAATGAIAGAVVAGPVGAVVGAGAVLEQGAGAGGGGGGRGGELWRGA